MPASETASIELDEPNVVGGGAVIVWHAGTFTPQTTRPSVQHTGSTAATRSHAVRRPAPVNSRPNSRPVRSSQISPNDAYDMTLYASFERIF